MSGFKVMAEECDECLFSENKIVSEARKQEIIQSCLRNNGHFICHKATLVDQDVCCRGFYDRMGHKINLIRIMQRLGGIEEVTVERLAQGEEQHNG